MKNTIVIILLSVITSIGYSQSSNNPDQKLSFGFNFGLNYSNLQSNEDPLPNDAEFSNALGYQMGILINYRLTERLSLNPRVEVVFNNGTVLFTNNSESQNIHEVMPVGLDLMTYLTYRFSNNKVRPYILLGPNVKMPYLDKVRVSTEFSTSTVMAIDLGVGLEYAMKNYTISPELRYSYGLTSQSHPIYNHYSSIPFRWWLS